MQKDITLTVENEDLHFKISLNDYEEFLNSVEGKNKMVPMKRFIKSTVNPEDKKALEGFIEQGLAPVIANALIEEFIPQVEISVKK